MDPLSHLLSGPRAQEGFWLRCLMRPRFSIRLEDEAALSVTAVRAGQAWMVHDDGEQVALHRGDVVVERHDASGAGHWRIADDPATPVEVIVGPGQVCRAPDGRPLSDELDLGVRVWGTGEGGVDLLTGAYADHRTVGRALLEELPRLAVVRATEAPQALLDLVAVELARDLPGHDVVLDRLLDLVVVSVVRAHLARAEPQPGWLRGSRDPVVSAALRAMVDDPARSWTATSLASVARCSRATLARRFAEEVGSGPMSFLTAWRLDLAADLVRAGDLPLASIADRVGYSSPFALSSAFKRHHGVGPREYRERRPGRSAG